MTPLAEMVDRPRSKSPLEKERDAPGLFLMTNSFEMGGSERQFVAVAESLVHSAFRVQLGCLARRGSLLNIPQGIEEFPVGGSLYGPKSIRTRLHLANYLREQRTSIAHAFDFYTNLTLIPAARMAKVSVVIGSQRQLGDLLSPAKARAQTAVFRWCDCVVCNSRAAADVLLRGGLPEEKIAVIGNGLPDSAFTTAVPALARRASLLRVCMIARMNAAYKNHEFFLRAAATVRRRVAEVEFVLVGDGPLRAELERRSRELGLSDCVQFLGERHDIAAILASADLSVSPSASESLSNVILESMAAGVPVIATRVGGNPELVSSQRGILVSPGDEQELATAIESLLVNRSLRAEMGSQCRRFAESNFRLESIQKRYEDLYMELLMRKRQTPRSAVVASRKVTCSAPPDVAIVAPTLRYVGGQSVQADTLLGHWQDDHSVRARFVPIDPRFPRGLRWAESVPFLRTVVREPFYLLALWRGLRRVEIVHIFSASYWSFMLAPLPAYLVARALGKKTLIHYHSGEARDHLRRFPFARKILQAADCLVVPSKYLADVFGEFGLQVKVVPNMLDSSRFRFRERRPLRPLLICTRGFHRYYRVDLVVSAFAEVQHSFPEARLTLVGQGPLEKEIREQVQDLRLEGVSFTGAVTQLQIADLYHAADIFINASSLDNMPVSIMEGMACGTPIVSTAPEGMRHLLDHERTALLSEPEDAHALAQGVIRLLRDPDLGSRMARNAYEESRRYGWDEVRQQWLQIYDALRRP